MNLHLIKQHLIKVLGATLLLMFVTGCNTMHGVGEDVEGAGEAIQDSSDG